MERSDNVASPRPWLENTWYAALWSEQLAPGALVARTMLDRDLVFFRDAEGVAVALLDRCPHRFAPLSAGIVLPNGQLRCGYHGLAFDHAGRCVRNPHGDGKIPPAATVPAFPVVEKHTLLWIWVGTAAADPSRIPDYGIFDDAPPLHVMERGELTLAADYRLITDNLLDLSHASYLHPGTLGNEEMAAVTKTEVTQVDDTVRVHRRSPNVPLTGMSVVLNAGSADALCDKWNTIVWHAPGNLLLHQGTCAPGAPEREGSGYYGVHLLAPQTETTTRYLFSAVRFNVHDRDADESARIRERVSQLRRDAFALQDGPIITQQARIIAEMGDRSPKPALLAIDAGAVRFRRVLDRLIAQEQRDHVTLSLSKGAVPHATAPFDGLRVTQEAD